MFAPGIRQGHHVPHGLLPFLLGVLAVAAAIVAWAIFSARPASSPEFSLLPNLDPARVRSIAYSVPTGGVDRLYVRGLADDAAPRLLASFPSAFEFHARGSASPLADRLAILSVAKAPPYARMSIIAVPSGGRVDIDVDFDYLSPLAWSPDAARVFGVHSSLPDESGRVRAQVIEVDSVTGMATIAAEFDNALEVAPLGFSLDGQRLFIVVVDQGGSSLWVRRGGRSERVATLSPGRTRDWSLSPDGSRLAFVDVVGAGERAFVGRSLVIATGALSVPYPGGDQLGVAWLPGSDAPMFGGPGGSVRLTTPSSESTYVVPIRWSPDGSTLVAAVYSAGRDRTTDPLQSIELVSSDRRVLLSPEPGATFVGWVRDEE